MNQILKIKDYLTSVKGGQFIPIDFNYTTVYEQEKYDVNSVMDIYKVRRLKDDEIFVSDIDSPIVRYEWVDGNGFKMNRIVYIEHFYEDFIHIEICAWTFSDCYKISSSFEETIEINQLDSDFLEEFANRARIDFKKGHLNLAALKK